MGFVLHFKELDGEQSKKNERDNVDNEDRELKIEPVLNQLNLLTTGEIENFAPHVLASFPTRTPEYLPLEHFPSCKYLAQS